MPIPPLAPSTVEDGVRRFSLRAAPGETEIVAGTSTVTWGYNGPMLGPTLRGAARALLSDQLIVAVSTFAAALWRITLGVVMWRLLQMASTGIASSSGVGGHRP